MRDINTQHKKTTKAAIIVALILLTGITAGGLAGLGKNAAPAQTSKTASKNAAAHIKPTTTLRFTAIAGKTVLSQLQAQAERVEVKSSAYGQFVEAINGVKGGTDGKYWTYYINGQMANIGAGEYVSSGGEKIVWKFE